MNWTRNYQRNKIKSARVSSGSLGSVIHINNVSHFIVFHFSLYHTVDSHLQWIFNFPCYYIVGLHIVLTVYVYTIQNICWYYFNWSCICNLIYKLKWCSCGPGVVSVILRHVHSYNRTKQNILLNTTFL